MPQKKHPVMAAMGRKGGRVKSARKAKSSSQNLIKARNARTLERLRKALKIVLDSQKQSA